MRTCFDIEEQDEYHAARTLLIRRCQQWAAERRRPADELLLMSALDCRHFSADGRLTYWTPALIRRYLLEWVPRYIDAETEEPVDAPEVLRTLLRFIADYGLRDPRGAEPSDNEAAIDAAGAEFPAALHDTERFGLGKFWGRVARDNNVDVNDSEALNDLQQDVSDGRIPIDEGLLERLLLDQYAQPLLGEERTLAQFPVTLPPARELVAIAEGTPAVRRLRALVAWVGRDGRDLTAAGRLRLREARDLARRLGLPEADDRARSTADLRDLSLYLYWALQARLVRIRAGRLVPLARSASVVRSPLRLWRLAFETVPRLGHELCRPAKGDERSLLSAIFGEVVPDVLNSLYSLPHPMPLARLEETVWRHGCGSYCDVDLYTGYYERLRRRPVRRDLDRLWWVLDELGAITESVGVADAMFSDDLIEAAANPGSTAPFDAQTCLRLVDELAMPGRMVHLNDLATAVLRDHMLDEGREAGLVGELAEADAPEMLSVVTQHYPQRSKAAEVEKWLTVHHTTVEALVDAARTTPLRSRAAAILELLYDVDPNAPKLLRRMRSDPSLAPTALVCLVETGTLDLQDLTAPERQLLTAESSLRLMEMDGPEAIINGLGELPGPDAQTVLHRVLTSGHPDTQALEEFRDLVVAPLEDQGLSGLPMPPPKPGPGRLGTTRRARLQRRQSE